MTGSRGRVQHPRLQDSAPGHSVPGQAGSSFQLLSAGLLLGLLCLLPQHAVHCSNRAASECVMACKTRCDRDKLEAWCTNVRPTPACMHSRTMGWQRHWIVWQCCYLGCKTCLELAGGLGPSELDRPKPSEKPCQSNAAHAAAACLTSACRPQVHDRIPAIHVAWPHTKLAGS